MAFDPVFVEGVKLVGTASIGFFVGRLQTQYLDRVSRTKELQNKLVDCVREVCADAIAYHTETLTAQIRVTKSCMLKMRLERIASDLIQLRSSTKERAPKKFLTEYVALFDSVTKYPFEPQEYVPAHDQSRLAAITDTAEVLVTLLRTVSPPLL